MMKRRFLMLMLLAACVGGIVLIVTEFRPVVSKKTESGLPRPESSINQMVFIDPRTTDLGIVSLGSKTKCEFTVTNRSADTVSVVEVRPSCNCSKVDLESDVLSPGSSTRLTMVVTAKTLGHRSARVDLILDSHPLPAVLHAKWQTAAKYNVDPLQLVVSDFRGRQPVSRDIRFRPNTEVQHAELTMELFAGVEVRAFPSEMLRVEKILTTDGMDVHVTLNTSANRKDGRGAVVVDFADNSNEPDLRIPVRWQGLSEINVYPSTIFVGQVLCGDSIIRTVLVSAADEAELLSMESDDSTITLLRTVNHSKSTYEIRLNVPKVPGTFHHKIPATITWQKNGETRSEEWMIEVAGVATPNEVRRPGEIEQ